MGIAVMNGRLFVVGGFSGKAFLESIEYLSEDAQEWCIYVPSSEKGGASFSDSEGRSSLSESEDVHNGKTIEENGKAVEENGKTVDENGEEYGGDAVQFNHVSSKDDNKIVDHYALANGENGHHEEIPILQAIEECDHITKPETSSHDESRYDNGFDSDLFGSSETDLEGNGFM